ncbi:MAG: hypothetical protein Q8O04_07810 [Deltaproteobacteria bacterium]|nr:hypothetical protein [Deltaproteobacteria bacterium]
MISSEKTIEDAIRNLIDWHFLREDRGRAEIMLDEKGEKAIRIVMLKKTE